MHGIRRKAFICTGYICPRIISICLFRYYSYCILLYYVTIHALHTQYIIRTDVCFLWTLCSCPQVDREVILIQTRRSYQQIYRSTQLFQRYYWVDSFVYIYMYVFWTRQGLVSFLCLAL